MGTASKDTESATDRVTYSTSVRLELPDLPNTAKQQLWRDRQIQAQAYNWGVVDALRAFYRGEAIPNPRNNSKPLTKLRHETGLGHSLLLQRGGYWAAVTAVKKWCIHRRGLAYGQRKAGERTDEALTKLDAAAQQHTDLHGLVAALSGTVLLYRSHQRRRVDLVGSSQNVSTGLCPVPPDEALLGLSVDERCDAIASVVEASDEALEEFNTTVKTLRTAVTSSDVTAAGRKRLRGWVTKTVAAVAAEAKTDKKLVTHIGKGDKRMFRTRRDLARSSGPALVLFEGCTIRDGVLRLPGRTEIPLPAGINTVADVLATDRTVGLVWSGAVHVVDVTDLAGKVTRCTKPKHRKYHIHFLCQAEVDAPLPVTGPGHSVGCDWGVVVPTVCSNGVAWSKHASEEQQQANRQRHNKATRLQESMSHKTVGSNRYEKQRRERQTLLAKNTNVRVNHQHHVAKAVVTTPGVRHVVTEDTEISNMTASAVGTKTFPVHGSAGKRGLNRSIAETAPARQTSLIERAAVKHSVATTRVHPAYTSLTCFVCGVVGQRETQALFHCSACGSYTQADVQASCNVNDVGNPGMYPTCRDSGGRDSRRKTLEDAVGVFIDNTDVDGNVTNKYTDTTSNGYSGI